MEPRTPSAFDRTTRHLICRWTAIVLAGLLVLTGPALAAGWNDGEDRPSRTQQPLDSQRTYEAVKRGTTDPIGDTIGSGSVQIDATSLDVGRAGDYLSISMTFAGAVSAPDSGEANAIDGFIDIDADQDGSTGDVPWTDFLTGADSTGLGNEFYVDLFTYSDSDGAADLVDDITEDVVTRVPVSFGSSSMTVNIPLASLDGTGSVDIAAIIGTADEATDVVPNSGSVSGPATTAALINNDRFRVTVDWVGFEDPGGEALVSDLGTEDSALFYFVDTENLEILVKVIEACDFNDRYWVFYAAATDVEFTLTVTDTLNGTEKQYFNPLGQLGGGINDTDAFATCP